MTAGDLLLACRDADCGGEPAFRSNASPSSVEAITQGLSSFAWDLARVFYCEVCNQPVNTRQSGLRCDAMPKLVRQMLESPTGKTVLMFECKCGEHSWSQ
jgi:hypothetical protein